MPHQIYSDILSISSEYKAILLDAYGVFWDGNEKGPIPGAKEAMKALVDQGKYVGVLSNSSAPVKKEVEKLHKSGIYEGIHFHFFLTSGEIVRECLLQNDFPFTCKKNRYFPFCDPHPKFMGSMAVFEGSTFSHSDTVDDADFIYITVPHIDGQDQKDPQVFYNKVESLATSRLWMVCPNPDLYAHEGNPPIPVVRQGAIASMFEEAGGKVFYIGKPYPKVYEKAIHYVSQKGIVHLSDILMVGDTPETDIKGAKKIGIHSALIVETGIFASRPEHIDVKIHHLDLYHKPHYFIKRLGNHGI